MLVTPERELEATGLPCDCRVPRGRVCWYPAHAPEGREAAVCSKLRRLVAPELLEDAFSVSRERWRKRGGVWSLETVAVYPGYVFLVTRDVRALGEALLHLDLPVGLIGFEERAVAPLDRGVQAWLQSALDSSHVLRNSVAVMEDGRLCVRSGPLTGQEQSVSGVDCHRRRCRASVPATCGGTVNLVMSIDVLPEG